MKAAVWHGKNDIRIEDLPDPQPKRGEVKVRIRVCGICGSDLHEFRSGPFIIPNRPHPITGRSGGPVILGHEFAAEVVACGEGVSGFKPGERVVANPLICCGECFYCKSGQPVMCLKLGTYGFAADGAFAEFACYPEGSLYKLPPEITNEQGAFVEPLAVAIHAVKRAEVKLGDAVVVIGAGPIGLLVMQTCLVAGVSSVFVIEPLQMRRQLAKSLNATETISPQDADLVKVIGDATGGLRGKVAFDCVGSQVAFDTALKTTGRRAKICVVGLSLNPIQVPFLSLWGHEKTITFSTGYDDEFSAAIALLRSRRIEVDSMITGRISLEEMVESGLKILMREPKKHVKILVYP